MATSKVGWIIRILKHASSVNGKRNKAKGGNVRKWRNKNKLRASQDPKGLKERMRDHASSGEQMHSGDSKTYSQSSRTSRGFGKGPYFPEIGV